MSQPPRSVKIADNERGGWSSDRPRRPGEPERPPRKQDVSVRGRVLAPTDRMRYNPGSLLVKHFVCNPGRTSIDSYTTIERTDQPGLVYASGGATIVWTNFPAQKSAPLPDWLRAIVA